MKDLKKIDARALIKPEVKDTYQRVEKFLKEILGKDEIIFAEKDSTLMNMNGGGYLYYPESFKDLMNTKVMKRMARILQLGTKTYCLPNVNHTRLEHCKGTYYRALDVMQKIYENEDIRNLIKSKNAEKYVIAVLVRGLLHDIGHGPFSHTTEIVCNLPKGFHEDIGWRMIRENEELRDKLNKIYPGLPEIYEETIRKDFLGLNRLFEGQIDFDRGDFLQRDCYFANKKFDAVSRNNSELFDNLTIEKFVDKDGKTKLVPVFAADQIDNLDNFFMNRFKNYKKLYFDSDTKSYDHILKAFAEELIKSDESFELKDFLMHNMGKKVEEVDLDEYISYNDIKYIKGIMEVAEKTKNPVLKKLAIMSLPPRKSIASIYYGLMFSVEQVDKDGHRDYNEEDEEFVRKLTKMSDSQVEYEANCLCSNANAENIDRFIGNIKNELGINDEDLESFGIYRWNLPIVSYKNKPGEEAYVKGKDGLIYEYSVYPDRKAPIVKENIHGCLVLIPLLEKRGIDENKIDRIKELYDKEFKKEHEISKAG